MILNSNLLISAARKGDLNKVEGLLEKGAQIDAKDDDGNTALYLAVRYGHLDVVEKLIEKGADINARNNNGNTPLHFAALNSKLQVVEKLIEKGADINAKDNYGFTPLHFTALNGKLQIIEKLIEKEADINAKDNYGSTPLHEAVLNGELQVIEKLIEKEADINAKDNYGSTPLHLATLNGKLQLVEKLIEKGADVNAKNNNGFTPLHEAARYGHLDIVKKLTERGAKVYIKDTGGLTSLELANNNQRLGVVDFLINYKDIHGYTLLHYAVEDCNLLLINLLLQKGANINVQNNDGDTSLHLAAIYGHLNLIEKFIEEGADINAKANDGFIPLHLAASNGHLNVVGELIEKEADINAKNNNGSTPLHETARYGHLDIVKKLTERGAKVYIKDTGGLTSLELANNNQRSGVVDFLINYKDTHGYTLLHYAVEDCNLLLINLLLQKGANINVQNNDGDTPLHLAAIYGHSKVAESLISKHADVNTKNKDNWTPFYLAAAHGNLNIVKLILDKRDDVDTRRALTVANTLSGKNSLEILNLLKERIRKNKEIAQHLNLQEEGSALSIGIHNHCSIAQEDASSLQNDKIGPNKIGVTSGISKPSSWINGLFSWTKEKGSLLVSGVVNSVWPASMVKSSEETSYGFITKNNLEPVYYSQVDMNGTILLLDVLIRKFTGQRFISSVDQSILLLEAQGYALNIIEEFEKVVEQAGLKSGVSMHRLNIDYMGMQEEITRKVMGGKFNEVLGILSSCVEKACPSREVEYPNKLSPKKFDKFMVEFNKGLDVTLNQSMQQILNTRNSTLEVNDVKEQQISLEPKSYLSNTSTQGHLTQDKAKLVS